MTVGELIDHLKTLPLEMKVLVYDTEMMLFNEMLPPKVYDVAIREISHRMGDYQEISLWESNEEMRDDRLQGPFELVGITQCELD